MDQSKKTMRHFYCRDVLWETFEQMANDFDCSIDYLVNEAMRFYARSKNYQAGTAPPSAAPGAAAPANNNGAAAPPPPRPSRPPAPPLQSQAATAMRPAVSPAPRRLPTGPVGSVGASTGPVPSLTKPEPPLTPSTGPTLFLMFNNQRYTIDKDQFIIGRGSKSSDLPIKDGNISRKHAAVIRRNGTFYIKDLGSTNGIDYKGMRIDNKRIDEGDVFHLCDYELRFTYR
jgi:FHA domain